MNNFNKHEIMIEHKNFFAPTRAGLPNLFWTCTLSAFQQMNMHP